MVEQMNDDLDQLDAYAFIPYQITLLDIANAYSFV